MRLQSANLSFKFSGSRPFSQDKIAYLATVVVFANLLMQLNGSKERICSKSIREELFSDQHDKNFILVLGSILQPCILFLVGPELLAQTTQLLRLLLVY